MRAAAPDCLPVTLYGRPPITARPILLTACAAILGMIPIAHQVFWGPMALAIIGGLVSGTLVTLTVLPAALSVLMQRRSG